jgi:MFS family permease
MSNRPKLFVMMLLEYFIWGAWLPLIFSYLPSLGFSPGEQAWILNAFPIAAIVGMFFSNQFCDRNFAAEKFLGSAISSADWPCLAWPSQKRSGRSSA